MSLESLVISEFHIVDPYCGTGIVEKILREHGFVVVMEEKDFLGIVTLEDVAKKRKILVIDSLTEKPKISHTCTIESAVQKMNETQNSYLPVFRENDFVGVISRNDITLFLESTAKSLETEVKERVSELMKLNEKLKESTNKNSEFETLLTCKNKFALTGEIFSDVVHQWKQPLNNLALLIQFIAALVEEKSVTEDVIKGYTDKALATIRHLSESINDFRDFFRVDKHPVSFKIRECIEKTVSLLDENLRKNGIACQVAVHTDVEIENLYGELTQVLMNIIGNAQEILVERKTIDPMIVISMEIINDQAVLIISDNGGGIQEDLLGHIFDPFFTTKEEGMGIGLYLAKTIIEKHMHGSLSAKNNEKGAAFTIALNL